MARATSPRDVSRHVSTPRYALRVGLCAPVHAIRRDGAHTASERLPICATGANTAARLAQIRQRQRHVFAITQNKII